MGYNSLLKANTKRAFNLLKDLAEVMVLTRKTNTGFNFATNAVNTQVTTTLSIKGIRVKKTQSKKDDPVDSAFDLQILFQASDIGDPESFDTITASGVTYKIIPPSINDGFVVTVNVKEK